MKLPKGKRLTKQRKVILEALKGVKTHPTADEVYDMVRKSLPKISLGTVYRNLDILCEMGLIQKLDIAGRQKRFDGNPKPHCHVRCIECGRVCDVDYEPSIELKSKNFSGFKVLGYSFDFFGICPECQLALDGDSDM
ncbi:transcriptional repressor [Desulfohalobiaceae bacterium Ax17]|uniref:Fur family transcriptional regulator n=1 Tax=Desulfovulcanus ferrireducens TaxID=2831190 RepID=UPI00207BC6BE|nr:transcriptional repressor [Desulfovulcanus ferrireducens]MBT8764298.1 transcriptional repressor [Desulfovulcanus ferrireducens]